MLSNVCVAREVVGGVRFLVLGRTRWEARARRAKNAKDGDVGVWKSWVGGECWLGCIAGGCSWKSVGASWI